MQWKSFSLIPLISFFSHEIILIFWVNFFLSLLVLKFMTKCSVFSLIIRTWEVLLSRFEIPKPSKLSSNLKRLKKSISIACNIQEHLHITSHAWNYPPTKRFSIPKNYMDVVGKSPAPILGPVFLLLDAKNGGSKGLQLKIWTSPASLKELRNILQCILKQEFHLWGKIS